MSNMLYSETFIIILLIYLFIYLMEMSAYVSLYKTAAQKNIFSYFYTKTCV